MASAEQEIGAAGGSRRSYLKELNRMLDNLQNSKSPSLSETIQIRKGFGKYENERRTYDKGTPDYERIRRSELMNTENAIRYITSDIEAVGHRIENWKAEPLTYGGAETQERWKSRMLNKK